MIQELNGPHTTATRALHVLFCAGGVLLTVGLSLAQDNPLRAGTSRIEITPTVPVMLAGYESRKELSRGVHDPLSARAVAFEQGSNHLVLVSIDSLGFYNGTAEPLRQAVLEACRLRPSELFLCAIHTHSAPTLTLNPEKGHPNNVQYPEQFIEKYLGAGVVAPGFAGASGNIDPWFRIAPGFNTTNGWIPEPVLLGTMLGEEVAQVLGRTQKSATSGPIKTAIKTLQLPRKKITDEEASATESPASFVMTAACVGDIVFVGLGGEVFNEIGLAIKRASPFPHTFVFTHCNGAAGYVPTGPSYPEGGYEVQSSPFAPGADERLADEAKRMLTDLRSAQD